jgi:nitroreductase
MVIVGCADEKSLLTGKWAVVDTTIALQNIVIAASTFGIGSFWIGSFSEEKVKELLKIADKWKVVALLTLNASLLNRASNERTTNSHSSRRLAASTFAFLTHMIHRA